MFSPLKWSTFWSSHPGAVNQSLEIARQVKTPASRITTTTEFPEHLVDELKASTMSSTMWRIINLGDCAGTGFKPWSRQRHQSSDEPGTLRQSAWVRANLKEVTQVTRRKALVHCSCAFNHGLQFGHPEHWVKSSTCLYVSRKPWRPHSGFSGD